jgi:hypothetical protein
MLIRPLLFLVFAAAVQAQCQTSQLTDVPMESKPHLSKLWVASSILLLAATSLDAASSWGKYEENPFLRSNDGRFGTKGVSIKLSLAGAMILPQLFFRKNHTATRLFTITNLAQAGMYGGIAARNFGIPRPGNTQ